MVHHTPVVQLVQRDAVETPAFVYDEEIIAAAAERVRRAVAGSDCRLLYAMKPFAFADGLRVLADHVDGFAASSAFEARLARQVLGTRGTVHMTSPGLCERDLPDAVQFCDYVSFNSLSQLTRLLPRLRASARCGLRVNPQLSLVPDPRYDPCRVSSRLGVPLAMLADAFRTDPELHESVSGLHFHSNCDSDDLEQLGRTLQHIHAALGDGVFRRLSWLNLGGGYLFQSPRAADGFQKALEVIRDHREIEIFVEPGAALVREAGCFVSSVVDLFEREGRHIAVLDTTVNHMPEVFEYQFEPDVAGHEDGGRFAYTLAGCSCLAGDVFGEYCFDHRLEVGSRVVFANAGAYSMVKAHMFNGINLPTVYARTAAGSIVRKKRFGFEDYAVHCGVSSS